jgi:TonB family protein
MLRCFVSAVLFLAMPRVISAVGTSQPRAHTLEERERQESRNLSRTAQFVAVPHVSSRRACEVVQPPQPVTTPDPLFTLSSQGRKIKVSFIIGTDGRVHSPLILESAGLAGDRHVLETLRRWRYRPATCDGIPTEIEGKIEFSNR